MKKILIISGLLLSLILTASVKNASAENTVPLDNRQDKPIIQPCTPQVFEVDADEDNDTHFDFSETGGKVEITFNDTDGTPPSEDDRDQVIVTAGTGYEIVNVQYELEHYSGIGWLTVPGNNPTTVINVAGIDDDSRIDEVEVKLQTICPGVTPTGTPTVTPTSTNNDNPPTSKAPECSDPNTTKVPANLHVIRNNDKATVNFFITEGDTADVFYKQANVSDWQYSVTGLKPNADKFVSTEISGLNPSTEYTFGARQRFGCGGGEIITTGTTGPSEGQVLGASTMAATGTFDKTLMNLYMIFGMMLVLAGYASYAKEKKII